MFEFAKFFIGGLFGPITDIAKTWLQGRNDQTLARIQTEGAIDLATVQAHALILQNKWYVLLQAMFATPLAVYYGKVHLWDAAFHLGSTDAVKGDIATWDMWVMAFLFFHSITRR